MFATPLIPGRLYRVRGSGLDLEVVAAHPCDAFCIGLELLERFQHLRSNEKRATP